MVLGIGFGGLFDGIVFHQVLQWHHMLSTPAPPVTVAALELNTLADGIFHFGAWFVALTGVWMLRRAAAVDTGPNRSAPALLGGFIAGWGAFSTSSKV